jgi:ADP-ribose pyrophosphatase YjhB (NUDIX family)
MRPSGPFRYCPYCGAALDPGLRGDGRASCTACGFVHFRNPVVGVAVVLVDGGRVLLGQRARGPYAGRWCIPCGYVEWDEDIREAARREMREETGLDVHVGEVVAVHSNFHDEAQHTVGVWFAGEIAGGDLAPVDGEFTDLRYWRPDTPPPLAFPTDEIVLEGLRAQAGS